MILRLSTQKHFSFLSASLLSLVGIANAYDVLRDYSGTNFFTGWDFYSGWDNLTQGDAWYLDQVSANQQQLAYVNQAGNAIVKVDNTSNLPFGEKRNTIRITSSDAYELGTLWIFDIVHLPYGCSVWPAIWSFGPDWPFNGEIDILEQINLATTNQMALHTTPGCTSQPNVTESGKFLLADCGTADGCTVQETKPNSYQAGFAAAGGGVWAVQFDTSGIFIWFWSRPDVPASITTSTSNSSITDLSTWGPPSAAYPSNTCNIPEFFSAQNLVFDITLCGDWAGIPALYQDTCNAAGSTGNCYADNVPGPGSNYDNAYFEINYVRVYTTPGPAPTITPNATDSYTLVQSTGVTTISAMTTTYTTTYAFGGYVELINNTGAATAGGPYQTGSNDNGSGGSSSSSTSSTNPSQPTHSSNAIQMGCSMVFVVMLTTVFMMIL